jgi:hypothetical protein
MAEIQTPKINQEELLKKVEDLEKRLQTKDAEIQVYKMLVSQMEEDASQAKKYKALNEKQTQDVDFVRTESEKTLTKAKSMIFEKTKVIKNQELQIEAFTQQIESLKEVVRITKDLLGIRNLEVQQLEIKISSMEGKQKAEKERYDLMHKKLEMMIRHNAELKREYETQLCLFTALRDRYNERELAKGVLENIRQDNSAKNTEVVNNIPVANNESEAPIDNASHDQTNIANNSDNIDIINNANVISEENNITKTTSNGVENLNVEVVSAHNVEVQPVTQVTSTPEQITAVNNEIVSEVGSDINTPPNKDVLDQQSNEVTIKGQTETGTENPVQKTE